MTQPAKHVISSHSLPSAGKKHIEFDTNVSSCTLTGHTGGLIRPSPFRTASNTTDSLWVHLIKILDLFPYDVSITF